MAKIVPLRQRVREPEPLLPRKHWERRVLAERASDILDAMTALERAQEPVPGHLFEELEDLRKRYSRLRQE